MTKFQKALRRSVITGRILRHLQKDFDTIDYDVLLQKLFAIGFSKHIVN